MEGMWRREKKVLGRGGCRERIGMGREGKGIGVGIGIEEFWCVIWWDSWWGGNVGMD